MSDRGGERGKVHVLAPAGRQFPQELDAERSALGACFLKPTVVQELLAEGLTEQDFYLPAHQEIFLAMCALAHREVSLDVITLAAELRARGTLASLNGEGEGFLLKLVDFVPTPENVGHYIGLIKLAADKRRMIEVCAEMTTGCFSGTVNRDSFADFEQQVFRITRAQEPTQSWAHQLRQYLSIATERRYAPGELIGVPCGLEQLDRLVGGWCPEHLIVLAARPGVGKSAFALNNCLLEAAVLHKIPTYVFSLEMGRNEVIERLIIGHAQIEAEKIRRGTLDRDEWRTVYAACNDDIMNAPIVLDDEGGQSVATMAGKIRRFRADERFFPRDKENVNQPPKGLVLIDYLQLAKSSKDAERRDLEIADFTRTLKMTAKATKLPIIAVSQLNREVDKRADRRPLLSDLRESGAIEQDADIVIMLYRESDDATVTEFLVRKNRHNPVGTATAVWVKRYARFYNFAAEDTLPPEQQKMF